MNTKELDQLVADKMHSAGMPRPAIQAFLNALHKVEAGERGLLREEKIEPVSSLPELETVREKTEASPADLRELVVIKLNGGLGTSMGLDRPKSLIPVKGGETFLDFIVRQIGWLRGLSGGDEPAFYLMNSSSTRKETLDYLKEKFPDWVQAGDIDFLQSSVPKLDAATYKPISWPADPELEWCPPGHGDIYPSMLGSGLLDQLLERGVKYAFVSNSDNLGASVDLKLLRYFAQSGLSFLMEVAERTGADRKGGHLARNRRTGRLVLRESAQCPKEDETEFQNIERHRYFNTNNLWVRLDHLKVELDKSGGALALPLITNLKTVDPRDPNSPKVLQLESAMGAAIGCFDEAGALMVPRARFAPVKTTSDLLAVRSDAYRVTDDFRLELDPARKGKPPQVELDSKYYKLLGEFERFLGGGPPSLAGCDSLKVTGPVLLSNDIVCLGKVELVNTSAEPLPAPPGVHQDVRLEV